MKKNRILKAFIFFFIAIILSVIAYTIIDNLPPKLSNEEKARKFSQEILYRLDAEITNQSILGRNTFADVPNNWTTDRVKRQIDNMVRNYSDLSYLTRCEFEEYDSGSKSLECNLIIDDDVTILILFNERERSRNTKNSIAITWSIMQ